MMLKYIWASTTMLLVVLTSFFNGVDSSNVLVVSPVGTKSHVNFYGEIIKTLASRGHTITLVSSNNIAAHPNVTQINMGYDATQFVNNTFQFGDLKSMMKIMGNTSKVCSEALSNKQVQKLNVDDFDLVLIMFVNGECFFSMLDKTEVPFIQIIPNGMFPMMHDIMGNINFPSFVPTMMGGINYPMNFWGRLATILMDAAFVIPYNNIIIPWITEECKDQGLCEQDMSPLPTIAQKASLIFINSVRSLEFPARPYMPSVIPVGGLHCRPSKPLPQDLESWIQGSGDAGFIYVSFGTAVTPSHMPEETRRIMVVVLSSLPQRVLWKWDQDSIEGLGDNVRIAKWLPQQDILGDPKLKLFIGHGGLFSTFEATYHGAPFLGMPVFGDQSSNVARIVAEGWADVVHWKQLTEETFRAKIKGIINNKKYSETVKQRSILMRDQPMSPQDTITYWSEYVIRHKGAPHLRSPVLDMTWIEVYNMDVWLMIVVFLITVPLLLLRLLVALVRRCCRGTNKKTTTSRQMKQKQQ